MYEEFYGLETAPFHITPDPEFLYLSPSHKEALASIVYAIERRKGFVVVLGEVGLGKTTILRFYLEKLAADGLSTAYLFNPNVPFKALLEAIYRELGIEDQPDGVHAMVDRLHEEFIEEYRQGRNVVLIVDEAQNMPVETLEYLRVLSNLETSTEKLLQIVLVGQPEFADKLDLRELRQLKQRIAVRYTLLPLTERESADYIEHRLHKAGGSSSSVFTRGALRAIVRHAQGIPRTLNILCDNAMVTGLGYHKKPVTARIVREVVADFTGRPAPRRLAWLWASLGVVVAAGALFLASPYRELVIASAGRPVELPAPPQGPAPVLPLAAGGEGWLARSDQEAAAATQEPAPDGAAAADAAGEGFVATVVVARGDTLLRLTRGVYGFASDELLRRVVARNPGIRDGNRILVGSEIQFPDVSDLKSAQRQLPSREQ